MVFTKIFKLISLLVTVAVCLSCISVISYAQGGTNTVIDDFEYSINEDGISINGYLGEDKAVVIAESYEVSGKNLSVIAIGEYAFEGSAIESVTFPSTLVTVAEGAFYECDLLKDVVLPKSVLFVGDYAFDDCNSLTQITVLNSKTDIGESAFGYYAINVGTNRNPVWKYYIVDGFVLKGYNNSTANAYAIENGIDFEKITSQKFGDVNQDNSIDIIDLLTIKKCALGMINIDNTYSDINGDGISGNALDVAALKVLLFYEESNLPIYKVIFVDADGNQLKAQNVYWCFSALAPIAPEKEGYNFIGWDMDYSSVKSNITVKAKYAPIMFTVTFKNYDGSVIKTQSVAYGNDATEPTAPNRDGYIFVGWDREFTAIKSSVTVTAQYKKISENYTVTFKDYDGTVLGIDTVPHGEAAVLPAEPKRNGFIFSGWSGIYSNVTENSVVTAQYISSKEQNVFKVSNTNGTKDSTVSVTVELTGSVMMNGFELIMSYDSDKLKLSSAITGSGVIYNQTKNDQIKISYFNNQCINEYNGRVILTLKFTVLSDESVAVPLTLEWVDIFDASDNSVASSVINGQVVIN